tara:strand:- start:2965 stop:3762 length:798 start_codon:yes stop_codon:yes gene_type:complete
MDRVEYVTDILEADWVLGNLHYLNCEEDYKKIANTRAFQVMPHKFVFWSMHDNPAFAYVENRSLKFLCQPLANKQKNKKMNIVSVPLNMRHYEVALTADRNFVEECRSVEKEYDFVYVGQIVYAHRDYLANLRLESYDFEVTKPIWNIKSTQERVDIMKDFCLRLARADYAFAPRGIGSSSFRLYQAMMSGAVPIVSGMQDYPFSEEVDWSSFCIINNEQDQYDFDSLVGREDYEQLRQNAIQFWEDYVKNESCDRRLFDKYLAK